VDQTCWNNTPAVRSWMTANGIATTDGVYEYFVAAVDASAIKLNRSPVRWEVRDGARACDARGSAHC
jgi:hypothetical protein